MDKLRLDGRIALITGANHGIGAATARLMAAQGAKVFLTFFRTSPWRDTLTEDEAAEDLDDALTPGRAYYGSQWLESGDEVASEIRDAGGQAIAWEADLSDPKNIPAIFDQAETTLGGVDILVNNATHNEEVDTVFNITAETMDRYFAVNTRATMLMMKEFITRRKKDNRTWGRIVNLSQDSAQVAGAHIAYSSTKATIEMLTRSVVRTAGELGITVNAVAPGPVQTGWITAKQEEHEAALVPLGRIGQPDDLANAILFLVSDMADWITGQVIKVDGGNGYARK